MSVAELLAGKRVCICGGSGGVGKTTTAAAIALGMAATGARVAVVTIDPARRLADALGLEELANEPSRVAPERLSIADDGAPLAGELWAMTLDPKRTFDELIDRLAPDAERAAAIKANRVYRELASAVSGSQEFTAVAKLYELAREREFDLLVLDTPPSRNASDFLDAPGRLTSFLEGRALRAFARPAGLGIRALGLGTAPLLHLLARVTGLDLVGDLVAFFALLGEMTGEFSVRAAAVQRLLADGTTAFVLVSTAQEAAVDEAIWFRRTLAQAGLPFAGVIVNRVHHDLAPDGGAGVPDGLRGALARDLGGDLAARVEATLHDYHRLASRDARNLERLRAELDQPSLLLVPQLDGDVHDVHGLARVQRWLFCSDDERAAMITALTA
ncbi:MAG: ArsA family ATPase [Solirubrobacteraceae bacterium]